MSKAGRPTKYKKEYCQELIKLMSEGALDYKIAAEWNISRDTFYEWRNKHKEFDEAYQIGDAKCELWWANWGEKGMKGEIEGFDYKCWISFMNNKFRHRGWARTDKPESQSTQINIGNINVLNQKSIEEIDAIILEELEDQNLLSYLPNAKS